MRSIRTLALTVVHGVGLHSVRFRTLAAAVGAGVALALAAAGVANAEYHDV